MITDNPLYEAKDDVFVERTGKSVKEWVGILDDWGGLKKGHVKMTIYLEQEHKVSPNWAQSIAVRYQKEKYLSGLSEV